jgi:hypothetical protein
MSDRRKVTSPENGRLSKGPITQAGKGRSSHNAIRHGLLARQTVLTGEGEEFFENSLRSYYARFLPLDDVEESLVDDMTSSYWRIQRLVAIESSMMNKEIENQPSGPPLDRIAGAFASLSDTTGYNLLQRYDARLQRKFQRALHNLIDLRKLLPVEPATAIPEPPEELSNVEPAAPAPESPNVEQPSGCPDPPTQDPNVDPTPASPNPPIPDANVAHPHPTAEDPPAAAPIQVGQNPPRPQPNPQHPSPTGTPWDGLKAA